MPSACHMLHRSWSLSKQVANALLRAQLFRLAPLFHLSVRLALLLSRTRELSAKSTPGSRRCLAWAEMVELTVEHESPVRMSWLQASEWLLHVQGQLAEAPDGSHAHLLPQSHVGCHAELRWRFRHRAESWARYSSCILPRSRRAHQSDAKPPGRLAPGSVLCSGRGRAAWPASDRGK